MAPPRKKTDQITFRLPTAWIDEAERLAKTLARPGEELSRTDVFRMAVWHGLSRMRDDEKTAKKAQKKPPG